MTVAELIRELKKCPAGSIIRSYNQCAYCGNIVPEDVAKTSQRVDCGTKQTYVFMIGESYHKNKATP